MALTVGELAVTFDAESKKFRTQLTRIEGQLKGFTAKTERQTKRVSAGFGGIRSAIIGVGAALGIFAGFRILRRVVTDSISAAASFESFRVRLQNFLGTQEAATGALEDFVELAAKTPFTLQQVVAAGANLGSQALANREALVSLTQTTANLAAVTGIDLTAAASNFQRVLSTGIASADLFRERGVRQLIEAITSVPDLTAEPLKRQGELFEEVFGADGVFGQAAEALSFTLAGAISNVDDATTNLQAALGTAFRPAVIAGLREFLIPLLERLRVIVIANSEQILDFAFNAITSLIKAFALVARAVAVTAKGLVKFNQFILDARSATALFATVTALAFGASAETIEALSGTLEQANREAREGSPALEALAKGADTLADEAGRLATNFERLDVPQFLSDLDAATATNEKVAAALEKATTAQKVSAELAKAQVAGAKELLKAEQLVTRVRLAGGPAQLRAIQRIQDQIDKLNEAKLSEEDRAKAIVAITRLRREQARLDDELVANLTEQDRLSDDLGVKLAILNRLDSERAGVIREAIAARLAEAGAAGLSLDEVRRFLDDTKKEIEDVQEEFAEPFARAVQSGLEGGIRAAVRGDAAFDFADTLATLSEDLLTQALTSSLEAAGKGFKDLIDSLATDLSDTFEGTAGVLGTLFGGERGRATLQGVLGLGGAFLSSALRGTQDEVRTGLAETAVTSTQAVRGIVAGPTQIAIAQIGPAIEDAFVPTNAELRRQTALLASIDRSAAGGTLSPVETGAGEEAELILSGESPSLI